MKSRRSLRAVLSTGLLVVVALGLAVRTYLSWQDLNAPVHLGGTEAEQGDPIQMGTAVTQEMEPLDAYAAVTERPLFSPTRRPPEPVAEPQALPPPPAAPPAPPQPIGFSLVGVILSDSERIALVRRQNDGRVFRVVEGGGVLGWTARSIGKASAHFVQGDREEVLSLMFVATPGGESGQTDIPPPPE